MRPMENREDTDVKVPRPRNRERTKQSLVEAAIAILRERGHEALGVNAIADRAGVAKMLIYRYFGGLPGLLKAMAEEMAPLSTEIADRLGGQPNGLAPAEAMSKAILGLHETVAGDELTRNLLAWGTSRKNELTDAVAEERERICLQQTEVLRSLLARHGVNAADVDMNALMAIVSAGVLYLSLHAGSHEVYNGIDLGSQEGWDRIAGAFTPLLRALEPSS